MYQEIPATMPVLFRTLIVIALLSMTACGFKPLYGTQSESTSYAAMNDIYIDNIPNREGQFLRNELMDLLYSKGRPANPVYNLHVSPIEETKTNLDLTISADATRAQLRLDTTIRLTEKDTGVLLLEREMTTITSYNILQSQFTTRVSETNTRENALRDLAKQIQLQLGLYFQRTDN